MNRLEILVAAEEPLEGSPAAPSKCAAAASGRGAWDDGTAQDCGTISIGTVFAPGAGAEPANCAALAAQCRAALEDTAQAGMDCACIALSAALTPQTATTAVRTAVEYLRAHETPQRVRLLCASQASAVLCRQTYNLWYAEDKTQRL